MRNAPRLGGGCVIKRPTLVVIESPQKSTKVSNISHKKIRQIASAKRFKKLWGP